MSQRCAALVKMFDQAKSELAAGELTASRLDELLHTALAGSARVRQRLLYIHAAQPSVRSPLIGSALHEPVPGSLTQIDPLAEELPYGSVFDAILDGWRVVQFPDQRAPFEDREIDIIGYEFILEKLETYND